MASDGLLRVVNPGRHRIEAYTFDGDLEFSWGKVSVGIEGFCGCCNPVNFAILSDGSFITCEKGLTRVATGMWNVARKLDATAAPTASCGAAWSRTPRAATSAKCWRGS